MGISHILSKLLDVRLKIFSKKAVKVMWIGLGGGRVIILDFGACFMWLTLIFARIFDYY